MSAPVKRTAITLIAAMLISAFSAFFAITLAGLIRDHHADHDSHSAATNQDATATAAEG
jgi:hypothetical protein